MIEQRSAREIGLGKQAYATVRQHILDVQQNSANPPASQEQLNPLLHYLELVRRINNSSLITRNVGGILDVVSSICRQNLWPDLAACVVNGATEQPGTRYQEHTPYWREEVERCLAFNWAGPDKEHPSALFLVKF